MRIWTMVAVAVLVGWGARDADAATRRVTVCTEGIADFSASGAQMIAAGMLAAADVRIVWRQGLEGCPADGILITMSDQTPADLHPGAMAYAMPYEGAHIRVFYDRIALCEARMRRHVLAHVLTHEIGHILQGVAQHSESGVMKAHWTQEDYNAMLRKPLGFSGSDIDMITRGLKARAAKITVSAGQ